MKYQKYLLLCVLQMKCRNRSRAGKLQIYLIFLPTGWNTRRWRTNILRSVYIKTRSVSTTRLAVCGSGLLSRLPIFPLLNVKTDSGTDGRSRFLLRRTRWEVSASQPHIHSPPPHPAPFHSSCKSKLADFFCRHIFLSPSSHSLKLASLIVRRG